MMFSCFFGSLTSTVSYTSPATRFPTRGLYVNSIFPSKLSFRKPSLIACSCFGWHSTTTVLASSSSTTSSAPSSMARSKMCSCLSSFGNYA